MKNAARMMALTVALLLAGTSLAVAQKKSPASTPSLDSVGATGASIDMRFTAGSPTGAPAGFTLQWLSLDDYLTDGWSSSALCGAGFSGNANGNHYSLSAGASVEERVGDFLFDHPGASTNCAQPLACNTTYVFRSFSHANSSYNRSAWSAERQYTTNACGWVGCTYTQGFWKNHGPDPSGNNLNEWPVTAMTLGSVDYTDAEILQILEQPAKGNGLLTLAHQLIAAKLNIANGADSAAIFLEVEAAELMIGSLVAPPVGNGFLAPGDVSALVNALAEYNEGAIGPGHCSASSY
jgi:hypothetical protein